jgi:hypothetical protein
MVGLSVVETFDPFFPGRRPQPRRRDRTRSNVVWTNNDSIHHARTVTAYLDEHPRLELLYGARYSPHDNPAERIWAALKSYVANTAVSWPGRPRQIRSFFRPLTGSDAGYRCALDQPLAAAGLRAELLECRLVPSHPNCRLRMAGSIGCSRRNHRSLREHLGDSRLGRKTLPC